MRLTAVRQLINKNDSEENFGTCKDILENINQLERFLHPGHYLILELRQRFIKMVVSYGKDFSWINNCHILKNAFLGGEKMNVDLLHIAKEYVNILLKTLDLLCIGKCQLRGM